MNAPAFKLGTKDVWKQHTDLRQPPVPEPARTGAVQAAVPRAQAVTRVTLNGSPSPSLRLGNPCRKRRKLAPPMAAHRVTLQVANDFH